MSKKMSIEEAAKYFGISKEAIHNRIRRSTLQSVIENGVKMVIIDSNLKSSKKNTPKQNAYMDKYSSYLEEENKELKAKIQKLEQETYALREQKERLLVEERKRIEQIYKEKDEQLKNILNAISSKFLLEAKPINEEEELFEAEIEEKPRKEKKHIFYKEFLKNLDLSKKKKQKIKKQIKTLSFLDNVFICFFIFCFFFFDKSKFFKNSL
jgi:predicted DNA binding protein